MKRFSYLVVLSLLLMFHSPASFGQAWSGILAPARATDWTQAGIPGGVPSSTWPNCATTACNSLFSGNVTTASINAAIMSAPGQSVVRIPAGTFTANIYANRSNVVVRGAGTTQTMLTGTVYFSQNGSAGQGSYPSGPLGSTSWTGGLTRASTVLTLASTSGISAGQDIIVDQDDAPWVFLNGVEDGINGSLPTGNSAGRNDNPLGWGGSANRAELELVHVLSVNSSTQITIAAPGVSFDHSTSLAPQAFFWSGGNVQYDGIENMSVNVNGQDFGVSMPWCDFCWVKNVAVTHTARAGIYFLFGYRDEVRDSYIQGSNGAPGPTDYGVEINGTSLSKVENNIFFGITSNVLMEGSYGAVIAYNYTLDTASGPQITAIDTHLAHNDLQLWEGNVTSGEAYDNSWGSASQMTSFRNYASGRSPNKMGFQTPFQINAHNYYMNLVGNVFGDPTFHTAYQCDNTNYTGFSSDVFIYNLGFWDSCDHGIDSNDPYDAVTLSSLMRWGNWDAVTYNASGSSHHGTRWCTGSGTGSSGSDAYNAPCTTSETAGSDPTFPGLPSPSATLPASFYQSSEPSWFMTPWGSPAWPPIGPDVTGGNIANTGGHANQIPAQLCYINTAKDTNGFLTAFDASSCYSNSNSNSSSNSISTAPAAPTGLSAVVQ